MTPGNSLPSQAYSTRPEWSHSLAPKAVDLEISRSEHLRTCVLLNGTLQRARPKLAGDPSDAAGEGLHEAEAKQTAAAAAEAGTSAASATESRPYWRQLLTPFKDEVSK